MITVMIEGVLFSGNHPHGRDCMRYHISHAGIYVDTVVTVAGPRLTMGVVWRSQSACIRKVLVIIRSDIVFTKQLTAIYYQLPHRETTSEKSYSVPINVSPTKPFIDHVKQDHNSEIDRHDPVSNPHERD